MQREYKLNGYSFRDFSQIGINPKKLYYLSSKIDDQELIKEAFIIKFGCYKNKINAIIGYYTDLVLSILSIRDTESRIYELKKIRDDYEYSMKLFKIKPSLLSDLWEKIMEPYLKLF